MHERRGNPAMIRKSERGVAALHGTGMCKSGCWRNGGGLFRGFYDRGRYGGKNFIVAGNSSW